ncbi:MAG: type II toxin-antitoxin system VapC family toxin [Deltaproteobacteria bacterium]|nr:type II toxin-antitoxin system VapC family toxin [Deltaproteobacteria bacterium]
MGVKSYYLDSSIVLSFLLQEQGYLFKGGTLEGLFTSKLTEVETCRVFDRLKLTGKTDNALHANRMQEAGWLFSAITFVSPNDRILNVAKSPWTLPVKALDAIHIATALEIRERGLDTVFCTLDRQQGLAAQAVGFDVESEFKP